ncbi:hypothetical protein [Escherichia coli]|uniref:hypothetical protein n=1 Tax=Escherichia coli TaxID=562 RepID=UPI00145B2FAC|nr:hypothetical protein [Escherichia coli]
MPSMRDNAIGWQLQMLAPGAALPGSHPCTAMRGMESWVALVAALRCPPTRRLP